MLGVDGDAACACESLCEVGVDACAVEVGAPDCFGMLLDPVDVAAGDRNATGIGPGLDESLIDVSAVGRGTPDR